MIESALAVLGRMALQMTEIDEDGTIECPSCDKKWLDTMENAQCIRLH